MDADQAYADLQHRMRLAQSRYLENAEFVVEATSAEAFFLWQQHHDKVSWEQLNPGIGCIVGEFGGMPVNVSVTFNRIGGRVVAFWEVVSMVAHYDMAREWVERATNIQCKSGKGRLRRCNAMNFAHCLEFVKTGRWD